MLIFQREHGLFCLCSCMFPTSLNQLIEKSNNKKLPLLNALRVFSEPKQNLAAETEIDKLAFLKNKVPPLSFSFINCSKFFFFLLQKGLEE